MTSPVSFQFAQRWASGRHVGDASPGHTVYIRTGWFKRDWMAWPGLPVDAVVPKSKTAKPWWARWIPVLGWACLPNVLSIDLQQDFTQNGITTATIVLENVLWREHTGAMSMVYHLIERGALAPYKGYQPPGRPWQFEAENEWHGYLHQAAQIKVFQGYGDAVEASFTGLIDDVDWTSHPDKLTLTCRDFGGPMLMDQHLFGNVKDPNALDPITFAQKKVRKDLEVGHGASASSVYSGHPARYVLDADGKSKSAWYSRCRDAPQNTEWVQIQLPQGPYERFLLDPVYTGHEMFVSIYARSAKLPGHKNTFVAPQLDHQEIGEGWVSVPGGGTINGVPYVKRFPRINNKAKVYELGHNLYLGSDSIIRVWFRNLWPRGAGGDIVTGGVQAPGPNACYRAGVQKLKGLKFQAPKFTKEEQRWIFVGDISDIVKCVLRWCGFQEWDVETVGTGLDGKWVFNRAQTPMDVIQQCCKVTGYVFFIDPPTDAETSLGIPIFRSSGALKDEPDAGTIRDTDLLTGIEAKESNPPLPTRIWVRGKVLDKGKGGVTFHGDTAHRPLGWYQPPWHDRQAGVIKDLVHYETSFTKDAVCKLYAMMIALQALLGATLATAEIPGTPQFSLDDQVGLLDSSTGLNTRFYVATKSSKYTAGKSTSYKSTLGGALLDTPDMFQIVADIQSFLNEHPELAATAAQAGIGAPDANAN